MKTFKTLWRIANNLGKIQRCVQDLDGLNVPAYEKSLIVTLNKLFA